MKINNKEHWAFVCEHCHNINNIDEYVKGIKEKERKRILEIIDNEYKLIEDDCDYSATYINRLLDVIRNQIQQGDKK